jgi:hypothetical protein
MKSADREELVQRSFPFDHYHEGEQGAVKAAKAWSEIAVKFQAATCTDVDSACFLG